MIKTNEQWRKFSESILQLSFTSDTAIDDCVVELKTASFDAIKHGLSLAIDTISRAEEQYEHPHEHELSEVKKQIIEERERLEEV